MCFLDTKHKIYPEENFQKNFQSTCGASEILWFSQKSWKTNEIHVKSLNFTWHSWIMLIFTESAKCPKLHKPIWRFLEIFLSDRFCVRYPENTFPGSLRSLSRWWRCVKVLKITKIMKFQRTPVMQSQWFGDPRVLPHSWATVRARDGEGWETVKWVAIIGFARAVAPKY